MRLFAVVLGLLIATSVVVDARPRKSTPKQETKRETDVAVRDDSTDEGFDRARARKLGKK